MILRKSQRHLLNVNNYAGKEELIPCKTNIFAAVYDFFSVLLAQKKESNYNYET